MNHNYQYHPVTWLPIAMLTIVVGASAQQADDLAETGRVEYGIDPSVVVTYPMGSLASINGIIPCSQPFTPSSNVNGGISAWGSYQFDSADVQSLLRGIRVAVGYDDLSSRFESAATSSFLSFDNTSQSFETVRTRNVVDFMLGFVRLEAALEIPLWNTISGRLGFSASIPLSGTSRSYEQIVSPSNASYVDTAGSLVYDDETSTEISGLGLRTGALVTLSYRLPLGRRLFFEPSFSVDVGLTRIQPDWSPLLFRGGIAVGYRMLGSTRILPPVTVYPEPSAMRVEQPPVQPFSATINISLLSGAEPVNIHRQIVARYVPLVPVVFFGKDSTEISRHYLMPDDSNSKSERLAIYLAALLNETRMPNDPVLAHRRILGIVGSRLRRYPEARITITGTSSVDEPNRLALARARADNVRDYLINVWNIDSRRILSKARLDPLAPSNSEYEAGREENRRVELDFVDSKLLQPVQIRTVDAVTDPAAIGFSIESATNNSISRWRVDFLNDNEQVGRLRGEGHPPNTIYWELTNSEREQLVSLGSIEYSLVVFDSTGKAIGTPRKPIPLRIDTSISVSTSVGLSDNSAEFLLITFDFDRAELTKRGQEELKTIRDRIGPDSRVTVIGYTDLLGHQVRNIALAEERANVVAQQLPPRSVVSVRGSQPDQALYNNSTPEGRFLSRTVRVIIENPR